jgi:hypothetical protein
MNDRIREEALKIFVPAQPAPAICEYQREQLAIKSNFKKRKAEWLAREAAGS